MLKKVLLGLAALILLTAAGGGAFVYSKTSAFDESLTTQGEEDASARTGRRPRR